MSPPAPRLGVGLTFQASLHAFVREHVAEFDFLEVIPDTFWNETGGRDGPSRFEEESWAVRVLDWVVERRPLVCHSVALSLGSANRFDLAYVEQLARWHERYRFAWHSEHLAYNRLHHATGGNLEMGLMLPVPYDREALEMLVPRVEAVQRTLGTRFLLENNVYYHRTPEEELGEEQLLAQLTRRTGCGLLLDLHNVYTNARNHGFEPLEMIGRLDLSSVVEVHIAGGDTWEDFYLDAHTEPCPEPVWALLDAVLPRLPHVRGVVFELVDNSVPLLGTDALVGQLRRLRGVLERHGWESRACP